MPEGEESQKGDDPLGWASPGRRHMVKGKAAPLRQLLPELLHPLRQRKLWAQRRSGRLGVGVPGQDCLEDSSQLLWGSPRQRW